MKVIAIQFDIAWEDKAANFKKVRHLLEQCAPSAGATVVLPEMFATGFSMNAETIAESYGGPTEQFLAGLARDFGVFLIAGAAMRGADRRVRNKALIFSPDGSLLGFYAKMKPFTLGGEPQVYAAGTHPVALNLMDWVVSPFICYDLRFPELFRRVAVERRPELFVVIANFPEKRIHHWITLLVARAIENQAYVLGANRIGSDPSCTYNGRSVIIDPQGSIMADAGNREGWISAELDSPGLKAYRQGLPFLADLDSM